MVYSESSTDKEQVVCPTILPLYICVCFSHSPSCLRAYVCYIIRVSMNVSMSIFLCVLCESVFLVHLPVYPSMYECMYIMYASYFIFIVLRTRHSF